MKERREGEGEPFTGGELLPRQWKTKAAALVSVVLGRREECTWKRKGGGGAGINCLSPRINDGKRGQGR
jgi:hypothetical protein